MSQAPYTRFDVKKRVAYDDDAKRQFHHHTRRQLRRLADALGLAPGSYDLRCNRGGIAVSGEITLHSERLYVQASQPANGHDNGVLYRTCDGRKDYYGGTNNFASLDLLHDPEQLARHLKSTCRV